jgi:hypothetical protein
MNIEQRIEYLEKQLDILKMQCKQQPEFEYPIYMQSIESKVIVKFTGLHEGYLVDDVRGGRDIGQFNHGWYPHTDANAWQPIAFDEGRGIADKQLCECWFNTHTHCRVLRFYDAVNKCTFNVKGKRNGISYDDYIPIPYADYPEWAIEAEKTLED